MGLRKIREEVPMTQRELALQAGVSKTTIIHIEAGRIAPIPATVRKLAAVLEMSPRDLQRALREQLAEETLPKAA